MSDEFGLAPVKKEGSAASWERNFKEVATKTPAIDESRWIELRYDPKEVKVKILPAVKTLSQLIDVEILNGNLELDDVEQLLTVLASHYISPSKGA